VEILFSSHVCDRLSVCLCLVDESVRPVCQSSRQLQSAIKAFTNFEFDEHFSRHNFSIF